jgi:hypothetical protein
LTSTLGCNVSEYATADPPPLAWTFPVAFVVPPSSSSDESSSLSGWIGRFFSSCLERAEAAAGCFTAFAGSSSSLLGSSADDSSADDAELKRHHVNSMIEINVQNLHLFKRIR